MLQNVFFREAFHSGKGRRASLRKGITFYFIEKTQMA